MISRVSICMNKNYFNVIDSEEKAYILGFLYADGYFTTKNGRVQINLSEKDVETLEMISIALLNENKVKYLKKEDNKYNSYIRGRKVNGGDMVSLTIYCKQMTFDLKATGNESPKSLNLRYPINLPSNLDSHFIRGYFDGDGCLCIKNNSTSNVKRASVDILSSEDFCKSLKFLIENYCNINTTIKLPKNSKIYKLSINGNKQCLKFTDWLYNDSSIFMKRKYDKYLQLKAISDKCNRYYSESSSKYNNICFDKSRNKWIASIRIPPNKTKHIGRFKTEEEAYQAQQNYLIN
jgi:hypothetical protein